MNDKENGVSSKYTSTEGVAKEVQKRVNSRKMTHRKDWRGMKFYNTKKDDGEDKE